MKKVFSVIIAILMIVSLLACSGGSASSSSAGSASSSGGSASSGSSSASLGSSQQAESSEPALTGEDAIDAIGADGIDWNHMSTDELYEMAKAEGGVIKIYSTTADGNTAKKKIARDYPDLEFEYVSCDTDTIKGKIELENSTGNVNADLMLVKDSSGEIYNDLVLPGIVSVYYPATICEHIDKDLLQYGLPLYSTFNPWFYNTRDFPDGCPITSWWDIVEGYNTDTKSYTNAAGENTQKWTIYTKDIKAPSYAALWAQLIIDGDLMAEQYEKQYGEPVEITYHDQLQNSGFKYFPENNAGVELFWRFTQMQSTELDGGDSVVNAVHESLNGPTLGLCSASKIDNSKQVMGENGMDIAWVTGLSPYTTQNAAGYLYVVEGCDNPAGARLFIKYMLGGDDGETGCYHTFDKLGHWSVRDDVEYAESGIPVESVGLKAPDFEQIYDYYLSIQSYWSLWTGWRK